MAGMQRDDHGVSNTELVSLYEKGVADLQAHAMGMSEEQAKARPIEGKWSTLEVVAHLAGTEIYFSDRIERTIALERPLLMGVDERPYADRVGFQELDLGEELALFAALRRHVARVLRRQPADAWYRSGVHSEAGVVTVRQLVFQAVRHLNHHLPFIAEKRKALGM